MIERIAEALDVPIPYMFTDENDLAQLLCTFGKLPPVARESVLRLAEELLLASKTPG